MSDDELARKKSARYPSRYSPGKLVTGGQYILELICEKRAQSLKIDLPTQFWKLTEWKKYFQFQTRQCHQLLAKYHPDAIILALKDKRLYSVYSLGAKWIIPVVEEYNFKLLASNKAMKVSESPELADPDKPNTRPQFIKKNVLDTLRELE